MRYKEVKKWNINPTFSVIFFGIASALMLSYLFFREAIIDDGGFHLARIQALSEELSLSNIKPWIYSNTNHGTGYPLGIFYPDLFLYPFALMAKTVVGVYRSYALMLIFINFASIMSFYYCIRKILKDINYENYEAMTFVMSLLYLVYPYRLWCLCARMAVGESMFFIFFPIIVLGIYELFYNKRDNLWLFVGITGLVYSHILSTTVCIIVLCIYYIFNINKIINYPKLLIYTAKNAFLTIMCSLSVILPIIEMQNFATMYYESGKKTFGLLADNSIRIIGNGKLSIVITMAVIIICLIVAYKAKLQVKLAMVSVVIFLMWTDLFCWEMLEELLPFINILQFPFRLLGLAAIPLSVLGGLLLYKYKPIYITCVILIPLTLISLVWGVYTPLKKVNFEIADIGKGEYIDSELREYIIQNKDIPEVVEKYKIRKQGDTYYFTAQGGEVVLPLGYYKGYEITDGEKEYKYDKELGLIKVTDVKSDKLTVIYKGTIVQKVSLGISMMSFVATMAGIIYRKKHRK